MRFLRTSQLVLPELLLSPQLDPGGERRARLLTTGATAPTLSPTHTHIHQHRLGLLPGVYLESEPQPAMRRGALSHEEGFCPVRPGGGREGADRPLWGRGTFHSSWASEELDTEPPGDHLDSLFLAGEGKTRQREREGDREKEAVG